MCGWLDDVDNDPESQSARKRITSATDSSILFPNAKSSLIDAPFSTSTALDEVTAVSRLSMAVVGLVGWTTEGPWI